MQDKHKPLSVMNHHVSFQMNLLVKRFETLITIEGPFTTVRNHVSSKDTSQSK